MSAHGEGEVGIGHRVVPSAIGDLLLIATADAVTAIHFAGRWPQDDPPALLDDRGVESMLDLASHQLAEYFAGTRRTFSVPCRPAGTPFQERVWSALRDVGFGITRSYRDIALAIGDVRAVRAVGAANGRNPIPIIIPCHRVIGSDGSLTGFGGGIERKRWLLEHEGASTGRLML